MDSEPFITNKRTYDPLTQSLRIHFDKGSKDGWYFRREKKEDLLVRGISEILGIRIQG